MRVKGEGPMPCGLMGVGEGPGIVESKYGRPFIGPSGAELDRYLNGYTLPLREAIYISNLFKEWASGAPIKGKEPSQADLDLSEWELKLELQTVQPEIVFTLGGYSTKWFLGSWATMEHVHGILFLVHYCPECGDRWRSEIAPTQISAPVCSCPWGYKLTAQTFHVLPVIHPAAGLHQPTYAAQTAADLMTLSLVLKMTPEERDAFCWRKAPKGEYHLTGPMTPAYQIGADVAIDTEGSVKHPWGFSVCATPGLAWVTKHTGASLTLSPYIQWICHHYMHDKKVVEAMGGEIPEDSFDDTMVMAYLLGIEPQGLKALAYRHLGVERPDFADIFIEKVPLYGKPGQDRLKIDKKTGEPTIIPGKPGKLLKKTKTVVHTLDEVMARSPEDRQKVVDYAGADADDTRSLKPILWSKIQAMELEEIYEIDRRVLPLYARMEQVGMPVNMPYYAEFGQWLTDEIEVKTMLLQMDWPDFNPASPDQVAAIMFDHLKLPGGKKTPTGARFSTNDKIMEALKDHPFVAAMIEWRELAKLKNTFIDPLPQYVVGGRLHFELLATRVVSGRLAAKNPNTLASPKYTELGQRFRGGVQAPPGRLLGSWDLNQIELRVLAMDSGSEFLRHVFLTGSDNHTRTAQKIFALPEGVKESPAQRVAAKAVNFSIPMGTTGVGLAEQMRKHHYAFPELTGQVFKTLDERRHAQIDVCQQWIDGVIALWGIDSYIKGKHAEARRYGYVRSRGGRIRFLPSVLSPNKQIRLAALRDAQAYGPQAGARYFMKQVEYRVWSEIIKPFQKQGAYIEPILDIHDDLLLEFQEDLGGLLLPLITNMVAESFDTEIPITAKGAVGVKWSEI
jgi:uracil-DNA glycosylase family 4